jgi:hypothetical protein
MSQINKLAILLLLLLSQKAFSQNYYNSPYTRFKIGDLTDDGFAYNRALGGCSIALRPHNQINYRNPASFTAQDTTSFVLQLGLAGRYAKVQSNLQNDKTLNFNIDYFAIGFPVAKWWDLSMGAVPYSRIQYFVREETDAPQLGEKITFDYSGYGGFNEFYIGNGFEISNVFSLGANISYLFGSLDRTQISYLTDLQDKSAEVEHITNYIAHDFYFKLGAQLHPIIKGKHKIILGATYDLKSDINIKIKGKTTRYNTTDSHVLVDTIKFNIDTVAPLILPRKLGLGITYSYNNIFTLTGEYIKQDWTENGMSTEGFHTGLYQSYRAGFEITPANMEKIVIKNYISHITYSLGYFNTKSYLYFNDINISNQGFTAGLSLPIKNSRKFYTGTAFNIAYQYGVRGTKDYGLIKETTHFITFGLTLHDFWFLKPKYD